MDFRAEGLYPIDKLTTIMAKVRAYIKLVGGEKPFIQSMWEDDHRRTDIVVAYCKNGTLISQKLFYIKDDIIDCNEYHERYAELKEYLS